AHLIWIFLARSLAFESRSNCLSGADEIRIGDFACRSSTPIPRIHELNSSRGSYKRDCSKLEQARSIIDLSFLQAQPIALGSAEHLLDTPAQPIESYDILCCSKFVRLSANRQRGQQSPNDRLATAGRICLAYFHIGE